MGLREISDSLRDMMSSEEILEDDIAIRVPIKEPRLESERSVEPDIWEGPTAEYRSAKLIGGRDLS
jgi:hypothetical protein